MIRMPELPEVEAIRRVLEPQVRGLVIQEVVLRRPEIVEHPAADEFCGRLIGQTLEGIARRGKFLLLRLEGGGHMVVHLRMTGCLLAAPAQLPEEKHTHLVLRLRGGRELRFSDTRRFGRFWLLEPGEADAFSGVEKLGREPFDPAFSAQDLKAGLERRKRAIKECLLDQSVVAGIGNIYSDEILFAAGLHPARPACTLTQEEWGRLAEAIPERLSYFLQKNEMTAEEYLETKGREYRNAPFLQVYGKQGEPCPVCGQALCRTTIGGRSSTFCPHCQT